MKPRFRYLSIALASLLAWTVPHAEAQSFPNDTVTLMTPNAAGGGTDLLARLLAGKLAEKWGQAVVVKNLPGGSGTVAGQTLAEAKPDGLTMMLAGSGHVVIAPHLQKLPYDPLNAFVPATIVVNVPIAIIVHPSLGVNTVAEFIEKAKSDPDGMPWGSLRVGSIQHLSGELFQQTAGIKLRRIPYDGGNGELIPDLLAGRVKVVFTSIPPLREYVRGGELEAIGVSQTSPSPLLPGVPPISDTVPGYDMSDWFGVLLPAGTPAAVVDKVNADIRAVMEEPDFQKTLGELGYSPVKTSPAEAKEFVKSDYEKFKNLIASLPPAK